MLNINTIRQRYRAVRHAVHAQATKPASGDTAIHSANQQRLRANIEAICNAASLENYRSNTQAAKTALWHHLWSKNRYAGIRAQIASNEIADLTPLFDNYAWFKSPDWNIQTQGHTVISSGQLAAEFLKHSGQFTNLRTVGNVPKLAKIVSVARKYGKFFNDHPASCALAFVIDALPEMEVWKVHERLLELGYTADLTALHFMMDTGFQVIKPDVVISRLFLDWGWLRYAVSGLPVDLTRCDLIGKGRYGTKFLYTKPRIYKPIINLAQEIVSGIDPADLIADIGWCTKNPIREFDIFVVKSGQLPEKSFGIETRLYP